MGPVREIFTAGDLGFRRGIARRTAFSPAIRFDGLTKRFGRVVPADVALWRRLTGAEIPDLLGNVSLGVDAAYRDELVDRDFGRLFPYIC